MDIRAEDTKTAYDEAIAAILRSRMAELQMSRAELAEASGVSEWTFRRYFDGSRSVPMGNFLSLVLALKLEPGHVVDQARERVERATQPADDASASVASTTGD